MKTPEQKLDNLINANLDHILTMTGDEVLGDAMGAPCDCAECGWEGDTVDLMDDGSCPAGCPATSVSPI
jgi:hypothetical protein